MSNISPTFKGKNNISKTQLEEDPILKAAIDIQRARNSQVTKKPQELHNLQDNLQDNNTLIVYQNNINNIFGDKQDSNSNKKKLSQNIRQAQNKQQEKLHKKTLKIKKIMEGKGKGRGGLYKHSLKKSLKNDIIIELNTLKIFDIKILESIEKNISELKKKIVEINIYFTKKKKNNVNSTKYLGFNDLITSNSIQLNEDINEEILHIIEKCYDFLVTKLKSDSIHSSHINHTNHSASKYLYTYKLTFFVKELQKKYNYPLPKYIDAFVNLFVNKIENIYQTILKENNKIESQKQVEIKKRMNKIRANKSEIKKIKNIGRGVAHNAAKKGANKLLKNQGRVVAFETAKIAANRNFRIANYKAKQAAKLKEYSKVVNSISKLSKNNHNNNSTFKLIKNVYQLIQKHSNNNTLNLIENYEDLIKNKIELITEINKKYDNLCKSYNKMKRREHYNEYEKMRVLLEEMNKLLQKNNKLVSNGKLSINFKLGTKRDYTKILKNRLRVKLSKIKKSYKKSYKIAYAKYIAGKRKRCSHIHRKIDMLIKKVNVSLRQLNTDIVEAIKTDLSTNSHKNSHKNSHNIILNKVKDLNNKLDSMTNLLLNINSKIHYISLNNNMYQTSY